MFFNQGFFSMQYVNIARQVIAHEFMGHLVSGFSGDYQLTDDKGENQANYMCQCLNPRPGECDPFDPLGHYDPV